MSVSLQSQTVASRTCVYCGKTMLSHLTRCPHCREDIPQVRQAASRTRSGGREQIRRALLYMLLAGVIQYFAGGYSEVLNDSRQQHVQESSTNLFAASAAGARRRLANLRDILAAMRTARQMREHGLPTVHACARRHGLALKRDRHSGQETSRIA